MSEAADGSDRKDRVARRSCCAVASAMLIVAALAFAYPLAFGLPYHHQWYSLVDRSPDHGEVQVTVAIRALSSNACGTRTWGPHRVRLLVESTGQVHEVTVEELGVSGGDGEEVVTLSDPATFVLTPSASDTPLVDTYVGPRFDASCEKHDRLSVSFRLRFLETTVPKERSYVANFVCKETQGRARFNPLLDVT